MLPSGRKCSGCSATSSYSGLVKLRRSNYFLQRLLLPNSEEMGTNIKRTANVNPFVIHCQLPAVVVGLNNFNEVIESWEGGCYCDESIEIECGVNEAFDCWKSGVTYCKWSPNLRKARLHGWSSVNTAGVTHKTSSKRSSCNNNESLTGTMSFPMRSHLQWIQDPRFERH